MIFGGNRSQFLDLLLQLIIIFFCDGARTVTLALPLILLESDFLYHVNNLRVFPEGGVRYCRSEALEC